MMYEVWVILGGKQGAVGLSDVYVGLSGNSVELTTW